jgi:hypothetical protein
VPGLAQNKLKKRIPVGLVFLPMGCGHPAESVLDEEIYIHTSRILEKLQGRDGGEYFKLGLFSVLMHRAFQIPQRMFLQGCCGVFLSSFESAKCFIYFLFICLCTERDFYNSGCQSACFLI